MVVRRFHVQNLFQVIYVNLGGDYTRLSTVNQALNTVSYTDVSPQYAAEEAYRAEISSLNVVGE